MFGTNWILYIKWYYRTQEKNQNLICRVMVSMLVSSAVYRGFEPLLNKAKDYKISICYFFANHLLIKFKIITEIFIFYNYSKDPCRIKFWWVKTKRSWIPLVHPLLLFVKKWWVPNTSDEYRTHLDELNISLNFNYPVHGPFYYLKVNFAC
jgi:hypothetical protein